MNLRTHRTLLVTTAVVGALAYWRLLFWDPARRLPVVSSWLFMPSDPLPQVIFLIAAVLVYRRRESIRQAMQASGSPALGVLPLLAGSLLFVYKPCIWIGWYLQRPSPIDRIWPQKCNQPGTLRAETW